MEQTKTSNGMVKLTAPNGVKDTRTGDVYSVAFVRPSDVKWFAEA